MRSYECGHTDDEHPGEIRIWAEPCPACRAPTPLATQVGGGHYKDYAIQPVEFCQRNRLGYCESAAIKYIVRHGSKNGAQDLDKAIHYLQLLKALEYPEAS